MRKIYEKEKGAGEEDQRDRIHGEISNINNRIYGRYIYGRYTGEDQRPDIWLGKMRKSEEEQRIGGLGGCVNRKYIEPPFHKRN